jgi:hypothetical protein
MPIVLGMSFVSVLMTLRSLWKSEKLGETGKSNFWKITLFWHLVNVLAACYNRNVLTMIGRGQVVRQQTLDLPFPRFESWRPSLFMRKYRPVTGGSAVWRKR